MAEKSRSQHNTVKVREQIERSREKVARDLAGMRYELDFPRKLRRTFQHNPAVWIGAAVAVGLLLALLRARTKKVYVNPSGKPVRQRDKKLLESGALLGLVKLGMTVLQPMVAAHFAKKGAKK